MVTIELSQLFALAKWFHDYSGFENHIAEKMGIVSTVKKPKIIVEIKKE